MSAAIQDLEFHQHLCRESILCSMILNKRFVCFVDIGGIIDTVWGHRDRMAVEFITTYAISAYHH
jgi:hypothetical protein